MDKEAEHIVSALKQVIHIYGTSVLSDASRVNAFLMDFIPGESKGRKLIHSVLREGIGKEIVKACNSV